MDLSSVDCAAVDELAASYALGAVDRGEDRAISFHLASCDRPHAEARAFIDVAMLIPTSLEPVTPSAGLRDRLMASVSETPQEHRPTVPSARQPAASFEAQGRAWWQAGWQPSALAALALAGAVGLGAWGATLNSQLSERDTVLRTIASADGIYEAAGSAGSGLVIEAGDQVMFMAVDLADLPSGQLYEFWLIDADDNAVAAGTLTETDGLAIVTLERDLEGATTFAVTVETERVDQSVNDPVMVAAIEA